MFKKKTSQKYLDREKGFTSWLISLHSYISKLCFLSQYAKKRKSNKIGQQNSLPGVDEVYTVVNFTHCPCNYFCIFLCSGVWYFRYKTREIPNCIKNNTLLQHNQVNVVLQRWQNIYFTVPLIASEQDNLNPTDNGLQQVCCQQKYLVCHLIYFSNK